MKARLGTKDDIPEIVRVINAAYRVEDFFVEGDRTSARKIESALSAPGSCILVIDAESPGRLAGAVAVETSGGIGHFGMLSVDPEVQGRGLGRVLMSAIENHCRLAGCISLDLEVVNLREELPPFYTSFGFEPVGTAPFYPVEKLKRDAHFIRWSRAL